MNLNVHTLFQPSSHTGKCDVTLAVVSTLLVSPPPVSSLLSSNGASLHPWPCYLLEHLKETARGGGRGVVVGEGRRVGAEIYPPSPLRLFCFSLPPPLSSLFPALLPSLTRSVHQTLREDLLYTCLPVLHSAWLRTLRQECKYEPLNWSVPEHFKGPYHWSRFYIKRRR